MSKTDFQNGFALGLASGGTVEVIDTTEIDNLETLIDESGVLEDTEGTATQKVEQLIEKTNELDAFMCITRANMLFHNAKSFPSKAVINLPYVINLYQAFAYWNTEPIPVVEELTVNAPNITVSNQQYCMGQMFYNNLGVKKVILNMPDKSQYMHSTFNGAKNLEEVTLNFSTKNIKEFSNTFENCRNLKKIIGVLDFSSATTVSNMFNYCNTLKEVRFESNTLTKSITFNYMQWSGKNQLSAESKQSIFDGLATLEEGVTCTLTLPSNAKILQSQVDSANAKGWTVAGGVVVSEGEYYE